MRQRNMTGQQFDSLPYEEGRRGELLEGELIEALRRKDCEAMVIDAPIAIDSSLSLDSRKCLKSVHVQLVALPDALHGMNKHARGI